MVLAEVSVLYIYIYIYRLKLHNYFKKIQIFYEILSLLQWDGAFIVKDKYFLWPGLRLRPKLPRPWAG